MAAHGAVAVAVLLVEAEGVVEEGGELVGLPRYGLGGGILALVGVAEGLDDLGDLVRVCPDIRGHHGPAAAGAPGAQVPSGGRDEPSFCNGGSCSPALELPYSAGVTMMATASATIRATIPDDLAARIRALGARFGVRNIRVFGSVARGEASPDSDIDLLVDYVPGHGGFAFVEFCEQVEALCGRRVDVVTERSLHPRIRDRVLLQALPI
jgi:predicted nucleotidyltransferase